MWWTTALCLIVVDALYSCLLYFLCHRDFWGVEDSDGDYMNLTAHTEIEIYDLAGHPEYYSSHSAMMESLCLESPAVFVLMVDLTKPEKQLSKEIYKWSNLIETESRGISSRIIVVGSRKDVLSSEPQLLASKCKFVEDTAKDALEKQCALLDSWLSTVVSFRQKMSGHFSLSWHRVSTI